MKIANIDREFLHIFWTTWGNSMKFLGKMCLKIILKVTKNQGSTLFLKDIFFEKPHGGGQIDPPSLFRVNIIKTVLINVINSIIFVAELFIFLCGLNIRVESLFYVNLIKQVIENLVISNLFTFLKYMD